MTAATRRRMRRWPVLALVLGSLAGLLVAVAPSATSAGATGAGAASRVAVRVAVRVWPAQGQAAYVLGAGVHVGPGTHIAPIASMAKVMTAYLVLHRFPLGGARRGVMLTVTARDVADRNRRVSRGESTVPVRAGERLSERQALAALLLPSANNVAIMLARRVSSSVTAFVARMNRTARSLGMRHTRYTDPSGFDARTRSTASDQLRLALAAMRLPVVRALVVRRSYRIPVAGTVHTTDALLGHDGFVGIKTGSMSASGGCFMFRSYRVVRGRTVAMTGVVMGQYGGDLIQAGLAGARRLVDRVAPTPWRL